MRFPALSVALLWLSVTPVLAQQQRGVIIAGTVVAAGTEEPLPFAAVTLAELGRSTTTDHRGRFRLTGAIAADSMTVRVRLIGYRPLELRFAITGDTTRLRLRMTTNPQVLSAVRTTGDRGARERFEQVPNVGAMSLGAAELKAVPALAERDVMRTVQFLPSVSATSDYAAGYSVRGGESDQNLILLDGIPIYSPYHLYGAFSTFPDAAVGSAEMLNGGFTAAHGGRLSSVLAITSANEPRPGVHGQVALSVLSASTTLGGSLPTLRTTWNASVRRTHADRIYPLITDKALPYHFRDEHVHISHQLASGGRVSFTGYDGVDHLAGKTAETGNEPAATVQYEWGNSAAGVTFLQPIGERFTVVQRASISRFKNRMDDGRGSRVFENKAVEWSLSGSADAQLQAHRVSVGYEYNRHLVRFRDLAPKLTATLQSIYQSQFSVAGFVEDNWRVSEKLILRPGLRFEGVSVARWVGVSPRLSAKYFLTPDLALTAAASRHAQWMHSLQREDVPLRAFEMWIASDAHIPVATATHLVAGIERWVPSSRVIRVETFWKGYDNLAEPDPSDDPGRRGDEVRPVEGGTYGADLFVRQLEGARFGGWLAYTYAVAKRRQGTQHFFPTQDRRHNLNVVTTYRLRGETRLAGRFGLASGTPYTPIAGEIVRRGYDPSSGYWDTGVPTARNEPVGAARNSGRYPLYHRLDLSIERTFRKGDARITPSLQLLNVYNRQNVFAYFFDYRSLPATRESVSQLPILPTIGLTVAF